jgi:hypothetical protein
MTEPGLRHAGLDLVAELFQQRGIGTLALAKFATILGRAGQVGSSRPLPSHAALLQFDDQQAWVPAPSEDHSLTPGGDEFVGAPFFLHGGRDLVLPTIRLFRLDAGRQAADKAPVEYLGLSDWLYDAVALWRFEPIRGDGAPRTFIDHLAEGGAAADELNALAGIMFYALFGAQRPSIVAGLRLPACPMWLRPAGEGAFARHASRALVITARLDGDAAKAAIPSTNLRAAGYRATPAAARDWGLDPVHTPEGNDIRLTNRLGVGAVVRDRKLLWLNEAPPPLSASTSRLPFIGFNDPRRLLMAANMQCNAMALPHEERPRVALAAGAEDPPGVNLRIAFLAWQGWNHEDAWVLSTSAAERLGATEETVQTIAIRAIELVPELVQVGQEVKRGELLARRFMSPVLLSSNLEYLAKLPDLDERAQIQPELEDAARVSGTVTAIEEWDIARHSGFPNDWEVPEPVAGAYRAVYRVHLQRQLPLAVGDKLANRHGHKGVVGAIVPDDEMPRWRGEPLEALIDPISVLNRSNWGQVYEALAGATVAEGASSDISAVSGAEVLAEAQQLGADVRGRWEIESPASAGWMTRATRAVAGVQFVLRMPHHARDKISGDPLPKSETKTEMRRRSQRLGEMEHWALWAHGLGQTTGAAAPRLTKAAARLRRLLASAGFSLETTDSAIVIRRLALDQEPIADMKPFSLLKDASPSEEESEASASNESKSLSSLARLYDLLDAVTPETPTIFLLEPQGAQPQPAPETDAPAHFSPPFEAGTEGVSEPRTSLRWLPILPACDRPPQRQFDGSVEPHELTANLRRIARALLSRARCRQRRDALTAKIAGIEGDDAEADGRRELAKALEKTEQEIEALQKDLDYAVRRLMSDARAAAVGKSATGPFSSKLSFLRRGVLGRRLPRSGRATVTPGGSLHLGLDEIGLPMALVHALLGPKLPADEKELAAAVAGRTVWLKRDPVLHRWGLLPVRVRPVLGDTIRLPASLLGPLGADFDGDTTAVFADLPGASSPDGCAPPLLALHPVLKEPMFKPGKQYQYGLYLLARDRARGDSLREALTEAQGPPWPDTADIKQALQEWTRQAVAAGPQGRWWAIIEEHALSALADRPDMDFGLGGVDDLAKLDVVVCGAAKNLYDGAKAREMMAKYLDGRSLDVYHRDEASGDPIADVMVAAKTSIGQFGGALRRLLYSAEKLRPDDIQKAQCLTEQVTQKALSVKAGKPPLKYADFERQLRLLLKRRELKENEEQDLLSLLSEIGMSLKPVWRDLNDLMSSAPKAWLEWLRKPHELAEIVAREGAIELPLDDLRMGCWIES